MLNLVILMPGVASAAVLINEIAWMGTASSASDEWLELYNNGNAAMDLSGWTLAAADGTPNIILQGSIPAQSFFLLERTNDASVPAVPADLIYTGALSNSGEILILRNASGVEVDRADGSSGWAIGGNNDTKETAQRTTSGWVTAASTPKAATGGMNVNSSSALGNAAVLSADTRNFTPPFTAKIYGGGGTLTSGEVAEFRGGAVGLSADAASPARFLWSFGDGTYAEGATVSHAYTRTGTYNLSFNVIAEPYSASDYAQISVIAAEPVTSAKTKTAVSAPANTVPEVAWPAVRELPAAATVSAADPAVGEVAEPLPSAVDASGAVAFTGGNFSLWFLVSLAAGIFGALGFLAIKIYFKL